MWSRAGWVIFAALLATAGATAQVVNPLPPGAADRVMVLEGGTLIDGTGRAPIPDSVIVVKGDRITAVGRRGQVAVPAGANVINVTGRTILPGLIDHHVHLQDYDWPMFLPYGVTTIADVNTDETWIMAQKRLIQSGKIKGPRLLVAGSAINGPLNGMRSGLYNTRLALTADDARAQAKQRIADGVDIIKVNNNITDDQLKAAIEEANKAGLPVLGHTRNIKRAGELGAQHMEHMDTMARAILDPDEKWNPRLFPSTDGAIDPPEVAEESQINPKQFPPLIASMVSHHVFVNPTLVIMWSADTPRGQEYTNTAAKLVQDPGLGFLPAEVRKAWAQPKGRARAGYANVAEFLKEYAAAGGKVVVGTDTGFDNRVQPGLGVHQEMQMINDVGIPNMKVIQGATLWNAQLLKKDKDLGSIEVGKLADFLVIDGDPLKDIRATQNVRMVILDGQVIHSSYDPKWVNPVPQPYSQYQAKAFVPQINGITPRSALQGGQSVTLTLEGDRFTPTAVVHFDGAVLPTKFVSNSKLTATLDASLLKRAPGEYVIDVVNTGIHGTLSAPGYFLVDVKP